MIWNTGSCRQFQCSHLKKWEIQFCHHVPSQFQAFWPIGWSTLFSQCPIQDPSR
jgi:hypothetical protein